MPIDPKNKLNDTMYELTEEFDIIDIIEALRYQVQDIADNGSQDRKSQFQQVAILLKNVKSMMNDKHIKI